MKFFIKNIYILLFLIILALYQSKIFAKEVETQYKSENISNYFSGIISSNKNYSNEAFKYLKKIDSRENSHYKYNIEFIRTLVILEKFNPAFTFSRKIWNKNELFFEADLLLGLDYFIKKDFINADRHFERLNDISKYNFFFNNFVGNVLLAWSKAEQGDEASSLKYFNKVPKTYGHLIKIQNSFLHCYFGNNETKKLFLNLIENEDYNFSRYNFFLTNYLISKKENTKAKKIIDDARKKYNSNLLIKQTEEYLLQNKSQRIENFFNCKNVKHNLAEFFYILANLYSSEKDYQMSNFYLRISLFLNKDFLTNKTLLAENLFYQNQNETSEKVYNSLKTIGSTYSWYASKNIASILISEKGIDYSIKKIEDEFNLIQKPNFQHYYELANFYKDNEYYKESIKYYTLSLNNIPKNHFLISKIFFRRGTSYERIDDWKNAEKDLIESLKIIPDQASVLNYLAYTWVDKGINLDEGLEMLKKAADLKKNDGYIIDSLGWAYFAKKDFIEAEKYLQRAVELLPTDPTINDHYADSLWMLKKNIQARYFWKYVLTLDTTTKEQKDLISEKILFGINKKL